MTPMPIPALALGIGWPIFILAAQNAEDIEGLSALDTVVPEDAETLRAVYAAVLEGRDPIAAAALTALPVPVLEQWAAVLRGPLLTGAEGELTFLPASFFAEGRPRRSLVALLRLPLWQRLDVFQRALHLYAAGRGAA